MARLFIFSSFLSSLTLFGMPVQANGPLQDIPPSDIVMVRKLSGFHLVHGPLTINGPTDGNQGDRVLMHFDLSNTQTPVSDARLTFDFVHFGPSQTADEDTVGVIEVYGFNGDGVVSTDEWDLGTLVTSEAVSAEIINPQGPILAGVADIDVTAFVADAIRNGHQFASFNLRRSIDSGAFQISRAGGTTSVLLRIVPEPSVISLICSALLTMAVGRRRSFPGNSMSPRSNSL